MMKLGIALGALVLVAGCSEKREPVGYSLNGVSIYHNDTGENVAVWTGGSTGITAVEAARRCPQGWTQRGGKWVCRNLRSNEIYYSKLPTDELANVEEKPRDIYIIKDGKPKLVATTKCTGINGGDCNIPAKRKP